MRNQLTKAEMRILNGIVAGASNEQMAQVMRRKLQTIKNQVASLLQKYRVESRSALIIATLKEDRIRWDHARCEWFKEASDDGRQRDAAARKSGVPTNSLKSRSKKKLVVRANRANDEGVVTVAFDRSIAM